MDGLVSESESISSDYFQKLITETHKSVTVKFTTEDDKVFTQSYLETITIGEVKTILVDVFSVPTSSIDLILNGQSLTDDKKLNEFPIGPYGVLELRLVSTNLKHVISAENAYRDFVMPDIITVRVETEDFGYKDVIVEIEDKSILKPFIGGYLHKGNLTEYHDAYSQTGPTKRGLPPELKNHRETQTYFYRNRKENTNYDHATQMTTEATWIPNVNDKILTAGPYETAEEWEERRAFLQKVLTIQRYFHAWKMRKALKALSAEYKRRMLKEQEYEELYARESDMSKRLEIIGKVYPKSRADFAMVYAMIERWKRAEIKRISESYCGASKLAELYMLLDKEVEMLRAVEAHRQRLKDDRKVKNHLKYFKSIGEPIQWLCSYKNLPIQMDTLETQKGREYYELFHDLWNSESKVSALLNIKLTLHGDNCEISIELISLIDRACELIGRGLSEKHLDMLLRRIESLLIRHTQSEGCNEGVTNYVKRQKEKLMQNNLFYCNNCGKYRTVEEFNIDSRTKQLTSCATCVWNENTVMPPVNMAPYRFMLKMIRREECMKGATSSYIFILQDKDIHHLVVNIWHSHSAISEANDLYDLHLCRFYRDQDWAPWNCILLTRAEAKAHLRLKSLEDTYEEVFLSNVHNKHMLAKTHFVALYNLNEKIMKNRDAVNEVNIQVKCVPFDGKKKPTLYENL